MLHGPFQQLDRLIYGPIHHNKLNNKRALTIRGIGYCIVGPASSVAISVSSCLLVFISPWNERLQWKVRDFIFPFFHIYL